MANVEEQREEGITGIAFIDNIFFDANINRYGISAILLIAVGCLGGAAVGTGGLENTFQLALLALSTMFCLSMILAVAPMKWVVISGVVAMVIDIVFITINLLT